MAEAPDVDDAAPPDVGDRRRAGAGEEGPAVVAAWDFSVDIPSELITDRSLEVNLKEVAECKKKYPNNAVIVSLMVESKKEAWQEITKKSQDTGCDGFELNFGCPHGMSERGMGSAMGQVPEYTCMVTEWVKEVSNLPVIVKLTPNVSHIVPPGRAAQKGGADHGI